MRWARRARGPWEPMAPTEHPCVHEPLCEDDPTPPHPSMPACDPPPPAPLATAIATTPWVVHWSNCAPPNAPLCSSDAKTRLCHQAMWDVDNAVTSGQCERADKERRGGGGSAQQNETVQGAVGRVKSLPIRWRPRRRHGWHVLLLRWRQTSCCCCCLHALLLLLLLLLLWCSGAGCDPGLLGKKARRPKHERRHAQHAPYRHTRHSPHKLGHAHTVHRLLE